MKKARLAVADVSCGEDKTELDKPGSCAFEMMNAPMTILARHFFSRLSDRNVCRTGLPTSV